MATRRRKMVRRMVFIVFMTFGLAWFLPALVSGWLHFGDQVVISMKPYNPYDFEREAWLAGQKAGQETEGMTRPDFQRFYKRKITEEAPSQTRETFKIYDFAFDAGYRQTSEFDKRYQKK